MRWVQGAGRTIAYARDNEGKLEIFLAGPPLRAVLPSVARRLHHDRWTQEDGTSLEASRLLLPEGEHIDAVAATIIVELLRHRAGVDLQVAFARTEPLVAMCLNAAAPQNAVVTGLAGELLLLRQLRLVPGMSPSGALATWKGHRRSSRDFQIGSLGLEVKTSTTGESRHHIQGWYQVEAGIPVDSDVRETDLRILSVGIDWLPSGVGGMTLADLVKANRPGLTDEEWARFLADVRGYCGDDFPIDANGEASEESFSAPFQVGFVRLYDLTDLQVHLLTQADLDDKTHVVTDSVSFEILLPKVVSVGNPVVGWPEVVQLVAQYV